MQKEAMPSQHIVCYHFKQSKTASEWSGLGMVLELQYFLTKATVAKLRTASITHSLWMYQKYYVSLSAGNSGLLYTHNVCK